MTAARIPSWARPVALIAVLLVLWHFAIARQPAHLLPTPLAVAAGIVELARSGLLLKDVVASLFRVTWGSAGGRDRIRLRIYDRAVSARRDDVIRSCRSSDRFSAGLDSNAILWFSVGDRLGHLLILQVAAAADADRHQRGEQHPCSSSQRRSNFEPSPARLVPRFPRVVPQLWRIAHHARVAWLVVVAAGMIAVNSGLGFLIADARNAGNRYDLVVAGMVLIGAIGLLLDTGMRSLENLRSVRWGYAED
jgi:NitT/TauT family transport system permease protein